MRSPNSESRALRLACLCVLCVLAVQFVVACAAPRIAQTPTSSVRVEAGQADVTTETRSTESGVETEKARDVSTVRYGLDPGTLNLLQPLVNRTVSELSSIGGRLLCVIVGACIILAAAPSIFKQEAYRIISYAVGGGIIVMAVSKWLFF